MRSTRIEAVAQISKANVLLIIANRIWKRSRRKAQPNNKLGRMTEKLEHLKASVRAKVEHPFHAIKNLVRHRKTRYRGLA